MNIFNKIIDKYSGRRRSESPDRGRPGKEHRDSHHSRSGRRVSKAGDEDKPTSSRRRRRHHRHHDHGGRKDRSGLREPSLQGNATQDNTADQDEEDDGEISDLPSVPSVPGLEKRSLSLNEGRSSHEGADSTEHIKKDSANIIDEPDTTQKGKERQNHSEPTAKHSPRHRHRRHHRRRRDHAGNEDEDLSEREILERKADQQIDEAKKAMEREIRRDERSERRHR